MSIKKRKNLYLDESVLKKARKILGAKTETEAVEKALQRIIFEEEYWRAFTELEGKEENFDLGLMDGREENHPRYIGFYPPDKRNSSR
jgi:Arc/MetJ family transcription regulator